MASSVLLSAQNFSVSGKIVSIQTAPLEEVAVSIEGTGKTTSPNAQGTYSFSDIEPGSYFLSFEWKGEVFAVRQFDVKDADVAMAEMEFPATLLGDNAKGEVSSIAVVSASDEDLNVEGSQGVSSLLSASRDAFTSAAAFSFGTFRFRIRGYDSEYSNVYLNGLLMNNVETGYARYSDWGGLNDIMRNRDDNTGLEPGPFGLGSVGGYATIDTRASKQRKQTRFSYSNTNRDYAHRLMASYNSGVNSKNWAFTAAASMRYAKEGYNDGTFYRGLSYYFGVDKKIKDHLISLTTLGVPTTRGRSSTNVAEVFNMTDNHYYNSYWGYQGGEKRNSSISGNYQPLTILTHEWTKPNDMNLLTSVGFQYGRNSLTALDWYDARDPRPDYYGYLPSYYADRDSALQAGLYQTLSDDPELLQVNWDAIYEANLNSNDSVVNANGITGNTVYGKKARYLLEERRTDVMRLNLNSVYDKYLNDNISVSGGLSYQFEKSNYYKVVEDLLGADFHLDVNKYALEEFPDDPNVGQNDLNHPNRIVKEGDRYGYDYDNVFHRAGLFGKAGFNYNKFDFFLGAELSVTSFWRNGHFKNGNFPLNSEGKSEVLSFFNYGARGGVTYKLNGRNYFFANGLYQTRAPQFRDVFLSPRTRNETVGGDLDEKIYSFEGGYLLKAPTVRVKAIFYYAQFLNQTKTVSFFHDDLESFVNYTITGIDKRHLGAEMAIEYKVLPSLTLSGVIAVGQYIYTSRQDATVTQDNSAEIIRSETVYLDNYYVGGMPQNAYNLGLNYRSPKFWFASVNGNYAHQFWVDPNPARRTQGAVDVVDYGSPEWNAILDQQKIKGNFTLDLFGGYSWKMNKSFKSMKNNYFMYFNMGINNILNNKGIVSNAFEQLRYDFEDKNPEKFPTKFSYSPGINYFLSVAFKM